MVITQILAELYGCTSAIDVASRLTEAAKRAAAEVGATVVGECEVRYVPHGVTVAIFLAESHIVLTTWPELRLLLVDVLLCNPSMDYHRALAIVKASLCPAGLMLVHEIPRRIAAAPQIP